MNQDFVIGSRHRANLIAFIETLKGNRWDQENVRTLVIATDSPYVVKGCTEWLPD